MMWSTLRTILLSGAVALVAVIAAAVGLTGSPLLDAPAVAQQTGAAPPGYVRGDASQAEMWRAVRKGIAGSVTLPDRKAAQLVQSDGDNLRAFRNGPLSNFGGWLLLAVVVLLALFLVFRGRIRIEAGPAGTTIERFNGLERFTHWLTASSFVILALTGLNVLYGRHILFWIAGPSPIVGQDIVPNIGQTVFAAIAYYGKIAHNFIGFSFMLGLVMMFVLWVRHNIPSKVDFQWLAVGGGLFTKGVHPPARRFNAGQKLIFWIVVIGGGLLAFSGICLLFPYEVTPWANTFAFVNLFGFKLPTQLTALQETQLSLIGHSLVALVMIAVIIAHIYIGSIGMEGAIDAVGSGQVDLNWAREHHGLWVAELEGGAPAAHGAKRQPAE